MSGSDVISSHYQAVQCCHDDDDDDDVDDNDDVDSATDETCSRPDRPDCVPKIDLSWTSDDERHHRTTHVTHHVTTHVTAQCRRHQPRHQTAAAQRCVIQDGGRAQVVVKRGRQRRRHVRARYNMKHYTNHVALPLTPPTPRRQIVRHVDSPVTQKDADKPEVEIARTVRASSNDDGVCELSCRTANNIPSHDVISAHDVTVNCVPNDAMMQCAIDMSISSLVTNTAAAHVTDDVTMSYTGSSNVDVDVNAEKFHDECITPPRSMSIQRGSAASDIVRGDGGDGVCVEQKLEVGNSASLAERLLCVLDCCQCWRVSMSVYRSTPP